MLMTVIFVKENSKILLHLLRGKKEYWIKKLILLVVLKLEDEDRKGELLNKLSELLKDLHSIYSAEDSEKDKVWDHDHLTGEFREAAHSNCNLNYKIPRFIPLYFHNFSGYDAYLFVKEFGDNYEDNNSK